MRVQAVAVSDQLVASDSADLLVMQGNRLVRLGPLGRCVYEQTQRPISMEDLILCCVQRFGPAPDGGAADLVRGAVDDLNRQGLVVILP